MIYNIIFKEPMGHCILKIVKSTVDYKTYHVVNLTENSLWKIAFPTKELAKDYIENFKNKFLDRIEKID